jgi:histidinol dehydrogenase
MLTDSSELIDLVRNEVALQLQQLKRKDIASKALENSALILLKSPYDCIRFSNMYAPEHLILTVADYSSLADKVINAGSVFLGTYSCESIGDYASGPNHTLPTNGYAKSFSGVSTDSFMKKVFFQEVTPEGIRNLGPAVELMAEAEMLDAHKKAVSIRLKSLNND